MNIDYILENIKKEASPLISILHVMAKVGERRGLEEKISSVFTPQLFTKLPKKSPLLGVDE